MIIITIDGPAASGKGTLAKHLAKDLNFAVLDTGLLYRAVGYLALNQGVNFDDAKAVGALVDQVTPELLENPELRADGVAQAASKAAAIQEVRDALIPFQREYPKRVAAKYEGAIFDGRDMGTFMFPDATAKLFVTADFEERVKRRTEQLKKLGKSVTFQTISEDMAQRDQRDAGRKIAPLKQAEDALFIDTTHLTDGEVFEQALVFIEKKVSEGKRCNSGASNGKTSGAAG